MSIDAKEKHFEEDIERFLTSYEGGYKSAADKESLRFIGDDEEGMPCYSIETADDAGYRTIPGRGVDIKTLVNFVQVTQPKSWERFERSEGKKSDSIEEITRLEKRFFKAFQTAVDGQGIIHVLKHGFKTKGVPFKIIYFKPETSINKEAAWRYSHNVCRCIRQFHFSNCGNETIDMVLDVNGIPLVGIELKNQFTGQSVENGIQQWSKRDKREPVFRFKNRMIAFFAIDLYDAVVATELKNDETYFLPFNQGSNGAGNDGGAGNPPSEHGYATEHVWKAALQKDSFLDIVHNFLHLEASEEVQSGKDGTERIVRKERIIFPRYHQLDSVRKIVGDIYSYGSGRRYLVQHSAGSGKSNSIAWLAYRLASLHGDNDEPIFDSVVVITDRRVLDAQLRETISGLDHMTGSVCVIDERMSSGDLRDALNDGKRLIVSTLQKFPIIFDQVESTGKHFAVIVDEAHSSQNGESAKKLKRALADITEPLKEWADIEAQSEENAGDYEDQIAQELASHGHHKNLTFCAFTATPKEQTLESFGTKQPDGQFHPFHIYSMRQAIEEGFILDPLLHYMTYNEALELVRSIPDDPEMHTTSTVKLLRRYKELHPYAIGQKVNIILDVFDDITSKAIIDSRGKMMVVCDSRLAAVRYFLSLKECIREKGRNDIEVLVAFTDEIEDPDTGISYSEATLNVGRDGRPIKESQTRNEFHDHGDILVVAEKYQTGFDEPLLHSLVIDKSLRDVKAVQTICRVNRIAPGKKDTFILDFVNSLETIQESFQRFYNGVSLTDQINVDLIYRTQSELHEFNVYGSDDVKKAAAIEFGNNSQKDIQGRLSSALKPVVFRYESIEDPNTRYQFRRKIRSFLKWYSFATQITRMFDYELHEEYTFLRYLIRLLRGDKVDVASVDDKISMSYYKLEKDFEGSLSLASVSRSMDPGSPAKNSRLDDKREPLQKILDKINDQYFGNFTEEDKVVAGQLLGRLKGNEEVAESLQNDGEMIFRSNQFPKIFNAEVMRAYEESTTAFESLFEDREKYQAVMGAIADLLIREFRNESGSDG